MLLKEFKHRYGLNRWIDSLGPTENINEKNDLKRRLRTQFRMKDLGESKSLYMITQKEFRIHYKHFGGLGLGMVIKQ